VDVELQPGLVAYKLILDGTWQLDPESHLRKYIGSVENSAVRVTDCHLPTLSLSDKTIARPLAGQGEFKAHVAVTPGRGGSPVDPATVKATLRAEDQTAPISGVTVDAHSGTITIDSPSLADGKYTIFVDASDHAGKPAKTLRLVFWIEANEFSWNDALIYMVMTDRYKDGDPTNNQAPTTGVDYRADWHGGDLQGVTAKINDGTLDALGVRALWLSPFNTNPPDAWLAADGVHKVMGYHGYWPIKAREVDPRLGGDAALHALTKAAHAHGIRVLQDLVIQHVHKEHEYLTSHPEWFKTGCVCGTNNCDWTTHRLDCVFADYMPDIDWTSDALNQQFGDDAVWWLDTYGIDGFRMDAVKHVVDACVWNLSDRIRNEFEAAGTRVFMTGETAMGWVGDNLASNADQYGTISRYIGPYQLDGQTDFVLYHAVPYRAFAADAKGLIHADYWAQQSLPGSQYPARAIMTPFIGSQDTPRFVTLASYPLGDGTPGNQWDNVAAGPSGSDPYQRTRLALAWLFALPGAPLLYYGDEYAEWGGADPNNRKDWRGDGALATEEQNTLSLVKLLGAARRNLVALRRGTYTPVMSTDNTLIFARNDNVGNVALVALSKLTTTTTFSGTLPSGLGLANNTVLHDRLGGPDVTVSGGAVSVTLSPRGAAILAP
jgi:glycosidase